MDKIQSSTGFDILTATLVTILILCDVALGMGK
jgi:hypothetical protein